MHELRIDIWNSWLVCEVSFFTNFRGWNGRLSKMQERVCGILWTLQPRVHSNLQLWADQGSVSPRIAPTSTPSTVSPNVVTPGGPVQVVPETVLEYDFATDMNMQRLLLPVCEMTFLFSIPSTQRVQGWLVGTVCGHDSGGEYKSDYSSSSPIFCDLTGPWKKKSKLRKIVFAFSCLGRDSCC
jgi:hypothetical protein